MIKAIIFDCFGVLTRDTWLEFCDSLPSKEVVSQAKQLNHQLDAGKLTHEEFINQVIALTDADKPALEKIFTDPDHNKNYLLLDYIKKLKESYKIGLLSNVNRDWVRQSFLTPDEQKLFDEYIFSFEVGATKPDTKMYETALEKLEVRPEEAVFIDDVYRYCAAAEELGIKAIQYQNLEQMKAELEEILSADADN